MKQHDSPAAKHPKSRHSAGMTIAGVFLVLAGPALATQAVEAPQAIESARDSLGRAARFPWYDPNADRLRPLELPSRPELVGSPNWATTVEQQDERERSSDAGLGAVFWRFVQQLMWVVLALLLSAAMYLFLRKLAEKKFLPGPIAETRSPRSEADSIEQLPFPIKRPQQDLVGEARRHYEQHNYREAIIYLFSYELVQLDQHHQIELAKGKTNRQYLSEMRDLRRLREILTATTLAFEQVFFGKHALGREEFEVCWRQLPEFESTLQAITID